MGRYWLKLKVTFMMNRFVVKMVLTYSKAVSSLSSAFHDIILIFEGRGASNLADIIAYDMYLLSHSG